ncbi:hypothetical protein K443DRAFT_114715, partial [Laccaria amethystina LaAM-08-1]
NSAMILTFWMIIPSILLSDLVRTGTILLIFVMKVTNLNRPRTLIQKLQLRLLSLEGKLPNINDSIR